MPSIAEIMPLRVAVPSSSSSRGAAHRPRRRRRCRPVAARARGTVAARAPWWGPQAPEHAYWLGQLRPGSRELPHQPVAAMLVDPKAPRLPPGRANPASDGRGAPARGAPHQYAHVRRTDRDARQLRPLRSSTRPTAAPRARTPPRAEGPTAPVNAHHARPESRSRKPRTPRQPVGPRRALCPATPARNRTDRTARDVSRYRRPPVRACARPAAEGTGAARDATVIGSGRWRGTRRPTSLHEPLHGDRLPCAAADRRRTRDVAARATDTVRPAGHLDRDAYAPLIAPHTSSGIIESDNV